MEHSSFPFHHLPVLVQYKILRQYVPFLCKTFVLSRLSEFTELLECQSSWLNLSETTLFHILRSLEPTLYWNLENGAETGYYVSINSENITFTLCSIYERALCNFVYTYIYKLPCDNGIMCISLQTMQKFLAAFFNKFSITNRIQIYKISPGHYFYINYYTKRVHWDRRIYTLQNKKCIVKKSLTETFIIILKHNDIIQLIHHTIPPGRPDLFERTEQELKPISLESYIVHGEEKRVYKKREILKINFRFKKDHISLCTHYHFDYYAFARKKLRRRGKEGFDELNSLFMPLTSCSCKM